MKTVKYSYFGWYKLSIFLFGIILLYTPVSIAYKLYIDGDINLAFWINSLLTIGPAIPWLIYLIYLFTYRLTVGPHRLEERSIMGTVHIEKSLWDETADVFDYSIYSRKEPKLSISKFSNAFAPMHRELDIIFDSEELNTPEFMPPTVPPLSAYRRYQLTTAILEFYWLPFTLYAVVQMFIEIDHIPHTCVFIAVYVGLFCVWYSSRDLPKKYFFDIPRIIQDKGVPLSIFWTVAHTWTIAFRHHIESNYTFVLSSILISVLIYQLCRIFRHQFERFRTQYAGLFYTFFISLPFILYCVLCSVNCFPSPSKTKTIYTTIQQKQPADLIIPFHTLTANIWPDQNDKIISVIPSLYDQVQEGDTVSIQLYPGVLGVPWVRNSYYGRYAQDIRHISTHSASTP